VLVAEVTLPRKVFVAFEYPVMTAAFATTDVAQVIVVIVAPDAMSPVVRTDQL